jgi:transposase
MSKIIERCAGIDIGKRFLLCSVLAGAANEDPENQTRRFDTNVRDLEQMREWLKEEDVTHVVMESTGSYWIPVFNLLEGHFTVVLANPEEVKNRKKAQNGSEGRRTPGGFVASQSCPSQLYSA